MEKTIYNFLPELSKLRGSMKGIKSTDYSIINVIVMWIGDKYIFYTTSVLKISLNNMDVFQNKGSKYLYSVKVSKHSNIKQQMCVLPLSQNDIHIQNICIVADQVL